MAIRMMNTKAYEYISPTDDVEPKTVFVLKPLDQFDFLRLSGAFRKILSMLHIETEEDGDSILDFFASDESEKFRVMYDRFLAGHVVEIRNIRDRDGNLTDLKGDKVDIGLIPPMTGFAILADAIQRVALTGQDEKN